MSSFDGNLQCEATESQTRGEFYGGEIRKEGEGP